MCCFVPLQRTGGPHTYSFEAVHCTSQLCCLALTHVAAKSAAYIASWGTSNVSGHLTTLSFLLACAGVSCFPGRAASHPALLRQASLSDAPASMAHSGSMRSGGSVHSEDAQDLLRRSLAERSGAGRVPAVRVCAQLSLKRRPGLASPGSLGERSGVPAARDFSSRF